MWVTGFSHWEGHWRLQSGHRVSRGPRARSHLGAHCPATPQSWMGRLPAAHSSFPATSRPQSGEGEDTGLLVLPPRVFLETIHYWFWPTLPDDPLHLAPSLSHHPHPHVNPPPLTRGCAPSSPSNPLIALCSHLLYHFHNLPSLQRQLVGLLRAVAEVHLAPFWGAPRVGRATWDGTRMRTLRKGAPARGAGGGALCLGTNHRPQSGQAAPPTGTPGG